MSDDAVFRAVADPTRRAIIRQLADSPRELTISEIASSFGSTRQAVTKHVDVLSDAGLVASRKYGRERLCRPQLQQLKRIYEWAGFYEQYWTTKLHALERHLNANPVASSQVIPNTDETDVGRANPGEPESGQA